MAKYTFYLAWDKSDPESTLDSRSENDFDDLDDGWAIVKISIPIVSRKRKTAKIQHITLKVK